jgi:hypothetical protein
MWQGANVSPKSQRTILRYSAVEYGCHLVVPKAEVGAFGQDHVPPITGSFEDPMTSKMIHFCTKPVAKLLEVPPVSTYVQDKSIAADDAALGILKSIDVVLGGGDHGQGKFRSVIKIILWDVYWYSLTLSYSSKESDQYKSKKDMKSKVLEVKEDIVFEAIAVAKDKKPEE